MFNDLEKAQIEQKFASFGFHCPVCGNNQIQLNEEPTHVIGFKENETIDFSKVNYINCVEGNCTRCGLIFQFKADVLLGFPHR